MERDLHHNSEGNVEVKKSNLLLLIIGLYPVAAHAQTASDENCAPVQPSKWAKAANEDFRYTADVGSQCIAYRFHNQPSGVLTKIKLFDMAANRPVIEEFSLARCGTDEVCTAQTAALITFVESSAPSEARLSYGGLLGEAYQEPITIPLRSDLLPEPQSVEQKLWSRIVGWFGTSSGQTVKLDVTLKQEFFPTEQTISYQVYSPSSDAAPVAYMGYSRAQPYSAVWIENLPGEKVLMLEKHAAFWNKPQSIGGTEILDARVPAKEWGYALDQITLKYWNESTGTSDNLVKFSVVVIEPR